jgi:hypothetical protein
MCIDNFSHQRLDPEKQFQTFAYGIVGPVSLPESVVIVDVSFH